jgi:serine/threonine-protein kinase
MPDERRREGEAQGPHGTLALDGAAPRLSGPDQPTIQAPLGSQDRPTGSGSEPPAAPDFFKSNLDRAAPPHELVKLIGKGGMGEVYIALDPELRRKVAWKRLLPEHVDNPRLAARFITEVQVTAQLDHPNIVTIHGMELAADGTLGYSMKLVRGKDLQKLIEKWRAEAPSLKRGDERRRLASRLDIFLRVCEAMSYAHGKGVLHRDLKPENVMVGAYNDVYVMDWGTFRLIGGPAEEERVSLAPAAAEVAGHGKTLDGSVMGTPAYMSPEQAAGKVSSLDERSDVCALGLVLFELVTLQRVRGGSTPEPTIEETLDQARKGVIRPMAHVDPRHRVPRELRAIVARATALDPADRYATARALADDVRRFLRGEAPAARPDNPVQRAARALARHRMAALVIILILVAAGAIGVAWQIRARDLADEAARRRQGQLQTLAVSAARQADAIDQALYRWENAVSRLVGRAGEAVVTPSAVTPGTVVYEARRFDDPTGGPPDTAPSKRYGMRISVDAPVVKLPGSTPLEGTLAEQAMRIVELRDTLRDVLLATGGTDTAALDEAGARAVLLGDGVPGLRSFVTLASGVHVSYPGHGGYDVDYDGRKRKKYTSAAADTSPGAVRRIHWGDPYPDRYGLGFVVPATAALLDRDGRLAGAAGIEVSLDWIAGELLPLADAPWATDYFLLRSNGDVLVHLPAGGRPEFPAARGTGEDAHVSFGGFAHAQALAAVEGPDAGVVRLDDGRLAVFYPVAALGGTYVIVADPATLPASFTK